MFMIVLKYVSFLYMRIIARRNKDARDYLELVELLITCLHPDNTVRLLKACTGIYEQNVEAGNALGQLIYHPERMRQIVTYLRREFANRQYTPWPVVFDGPVAVLREDQFDTAINTLTGIVGNDPDFQYSATLFNDIA